MAPLFAAVSLVRRARTFHPRGLLFHAVLEPSKDASPRLEPLASRLAGPAIVRFSAALWKSSQRLPDVLGCALRLRRDERSTDAPAGDDQDLLFATILRPWTMPLAPFTTDVGDYLANKYYAVSPFDVGLKRPIYLRLRPACAKAAASGDRNDRLLLAVARGSARLFLEVSTSPFGPWDPCMTLTLKRMANIDGEAIRFRPFRTGRGVHPHGFVHALRAGAYFASQLTRPESEVPARKHGRGNGWQLPA
jgi:hypothetical protein